LAPDICRAVDEGCAVVLVAPDGSTRTLVAQAPDAQSGVGARRRDELVALAQQALAFPGFQRLLTIPGLDVGTAAEPRPTESIR
jgi:hypothetical protein